jgi:two-component system chemotaxis response regulator CheY
MVSVLIVDDDVFLHKVLERILSIGGHDVVGHAYDGAEAVEMFNELNPKPDIILMDHRMPVLNGASATREIMHSDPKTRILFISADETVMSEAIQAGAVGFLTKPIRSNDLFTSIEKHVPKK